MSIKLIISFCFVLCASCKVKEVETHSRKIDKPQLVAAWATSEKSPLKRLLAVYDDEQFLVIESSDVGQETRYSGKYREVSNSIIITPLKSSNKSVEQFSYYRKLGEIQWIESSLRRQWKMYKCSGLEDVEEWGVFIQNDQAFKKRVKESANQFFPNPPQAP